MQSGRRAGLGADHRHGGDLAHRFRAWAGARGGAVACAVGPEQFLRSQGPSTQFHRTFIVPTYVSTSYTLHIMNGNPNGSQQVVSGRVSIDGQEVVSVTGLTAQTLVVDRSLTLSAGSHALDVELFGVSNTFIRLTVSGVIQLGDLTQPRTRHAAVLQSDGTSLIMGGTGSSGPLDDAERFDPVTLQSTGLASRLTTHRTNQTATLLPETSTVLIGGQDLAGSLFTTERFRPPLQAFEALSSALQVARHGHTATLLSDGRVLILGGVDPTPLPVPSAEALDPRPDPLSAAIYDPHTGEMTLLPGGLQVPRSDHTATLLPNGFVLVTGGWNGGGDLASAEMFNPSAGTSTLLSATLSTPRSGHTATLRPNGTVLLVGGRNGGMLWQHGDLSASDAVLHPRDHHIAEIPRGSYRDAVAERGNPDRRRDYAAGPHGTHGAHRTADPGRDRAASDRRVTSRRGRQRLPQLTRIARLHRADQGLDAQWRDAAAASGDGPSLRSPEHREGGLMAFFVPGTPLAAGTTYTLTVNGLQDVAGNVVAPFTSSFTTFPLPTITGFTPSQGPPGSLVTLSGHGFDGSTLPHNRVELGGIPATVTAATATSLVVEVPPGASDGPIPSTRPVERRSARRISS